MTTSEVKTITGPHWNDFLTWMRGKTYGTYPDGTRNHYVWHVQNFMKQFEENV